DAPHRAGPGTTVRGGLPGVGGAKEPGQLWQGIDVGYCVRRFHWGHGNLDRYAAQPGFGRGGFRNLRGGDWIYRLDAFRDPNRRTTFSAQLVLSGEPYL